MYRLLLFIIILYISSVKNEDCVIPDINFGKILDKNVGDTLSETTKFSVSCNSGYQLSDQSVTEVSCVENQMPLSCRELKVVSSNTNYGTGTEVKVTCTVTSTDKVTGISWTLDDKAFREQGAFASGQTTSPFQSILTFTGTAADAGSFGCTATIESTSEFKQEKSYGLDIKIIDVTMLPADTATVYPNVGEQIPLTCQFTMLSGYSLEILWKMGTSTITNTFDESKDGVTESKTLLVATKSKSYNNKYTCQGTYTNLNDNSKIILSKYKQVEVRGIVKDPTDQNLQIGSDAIFTCQSVGEVQGSVQWLVGSAVQGSSLYTKTYSASTRTTSSVLTLANVQKQSSAVQCKVTYGGSTVVSSKEATLIVLSIGFMVQPADSGFVKNTDNELSCKVRSQNGLQTQLLWYKGTSTMPSSSYSTASNTDKTEYTSTLYLESVTSANNGDYKCRVTYYIDSKQTILDSDVASVFVREVRFRPTGTLSSNDAADTKLFTCFYLGDADSGTGVESVTWWVNGVNVKGVDNFAIKEGSYSGSNWRTELTMSNIVPELAGDVECRFACGVGGTISGTGYLYVHRYTALPATTMTTSATSEITCSVKTNEEASVSWFKGSGTRISINDANFSPQEATKDGMTQNNVLKVEDWSYTKSETDITCKYSYSKTADTYQTKTNFIYKGFISSPSEYTYYAPAAKTLNCDFGYSISSSGPTSVSWLKDGSSVDSNTRYDITKTTQTGIMTSALKIKAESDVINSDSGKYTCIFKFSESEQYSRIANVHFYTMSIEPSESQYYDAATLTFTCTLTAKHVTISAATWTKSAQELTTPDYTTSLTGSASKLVINQVLEANSGTYTCGLSVPGDKTLKESKSLEIRNLKMLSGEYIKAEIDSTVAISCSVKYFTGSVPTIKWYKDTAEVSGGITQASQNFVVTSTLTVTNLKMSNLGEYKCGLGLSRSQTSTTFSAATIATADTSAEVGAAATVKCELSDAAAQPSSLYWSDEGNNQYKTTDGSTEYSVTNGQYSAGKQSTTLVVNNVLQITRYTCNFLIQGLHSYRTTTVTVLKILASPSMVYSGSTATLECRLEGAVSAPTAVRWKSSDNTLISDTDNKYTINTGTYSNYRQTTALSVKAATSTDTYTCLFTVGGLEFSEDVGSEVYEVQVSEEVGVIRNNQLQIHLQINPHQTDVSQFVSDVAVSANTTVNGEGVLAGLTVTYSNLVVDMLVTFSFKDNAGTAHSLQTTVYVAEFGAPVVSLSDGEEEAVLTCSVAGLQPGPHDTAISMYWLVAGHKYYPEPASTGDKMTSLYTYNVTAETVDSDVTCGIELNGQEYSHKAILDIIDIETSPMVELKNGTTVSLSCVISGSQHSAPVTAVWYREKEQKLIQNLGGAGWPGDVTTTLADVDTAGSYRCVVDFGTAEFSRTITVKLEGGPPDGKSALSLALVLGITVPILLVIILLAVFGYCYYKKHRHTRRPISSTNNYQIKNISIHSTSFGRPESLIYHNQTNGAEGAASPSHAERYNPQNHYYSNSSPATPASGNGGVEPMSPVNFTKGTGAGDAPHRPPRPYSPTTPSNAPSRNEDVNNLQLDLTNSPNFDSNQYSSHMKSMKF